MGFLDGLFVASEEDVAKVIGKEVYFGEVLGKHSEVYGTLQEGDLKLIDIPQDAIDKIVAVTGPHISGYNPISTYFDNRYEEEDEEEDNDE